MMSATEKLKTLLADRGVTYTFIAKKTGIPVDAISRSMLGKRRLLADEMVLICNAAGIDLKEMQQDRKPG